MLAVRSGGRVIDARAMQRCPAAREGARTLLSRLPVAPKKAIVRLGFEEVMAVVRGGASGAYEGEHTSTTLDRDMAHLYPKL
jgi:hypothetical protein